MYASNAAKQPPDCHTAKVDIEPFSAIETLGRVVRFDLACEVLQPKKGHSPLDSFCEFKNELPAGIWFAETHPPSRISVSLHVRPTIFLAACRLPTQPDPSMTMICLYVAHDE